MMAPKRLLIVENGEKLKQEDLDQLDPYLANPAPTTCLVITSDKLDMRRGALARANKRGQAHKSESIKQRDMNRFIRSRAKLRGVSLSPGALSELTAAVGPDCAQIDDAVERLGLYAGPNRQVSEEDVAEVVTAVREHSIFDLVDAIGNQKPDKALSLLENLLSLRVEDPLKINAMVARHFRLLLKTKILMYQGAARHELPGLLGVQEFVSAKLADQIARFTGAKLGEALARAARADFEMKSCRRSSRLVVEQVVLDLSIGS
jgi:DNA polymerase-3 subunit delta